jgi:ribosome-binding protein aMBF1 (putative translation factor)
MKSKQCELCGAKIPEERLEILPETTTCVKCSDTAPYSEDEILGFEIAESQTENRIDAEEFEEEFE